jgi:hypothetical protein
LVCRKQVRGMRQASKTLVPTVREPAAHFWLCWPLANGAADLCRLLIKAMSETLCRPRCPYQQPSNLLPRPLEVERLDTWLIFRSFSAFISVIVLPAFRPSSAAAGSAATVATATPSTFSSSSRLLRATSPTVGSEANCCRTRFRSALLNSWHILAYVLSMAGALDKI